MRVSNTYLILLGALFLFGCGGKQCRFPDDPRARADKLVEACLKGRAECMPHEMHESESFNPLEDRSYQLIQNCGVHLKYKKTEKMDASSLGVFYYCIMEKSAGEFVVIFGNEGHYCEHIGYEFYTLKDYNNYIRGK